MDPTKAKNNIERIDLPDGSMAVIKRTRDHATISRRVKGSCVWLRTAPNEQAGAVVDDMKAHPADFESWWLS